MMVNFVRKIKEAMKVLLQTSKNIRGLEYRMHPKAWTVVILDWNSNPKFLECGDVGIGANEAPGAS